MKRTIQSISARGHSLVCTILILALLLSLLTACGGGKEEDSSSAKTLTAATNSDCVTFSPWGASGGGRKAVRRALYETLTYLNADGTVSYDLAKEVNETAEGVYEIVLYDYIYDTAGNHLTASDVVFSFQKAQEAGTYATYFDSFESIKATGTYTLEVRLTDEKVGGIYVLFDMIYIVTEAAYEQSGDEMTLNPIGTTAYVLDEYVSGAKMVFKKVDTYWQTEELTIDALQANVDSFTWLIITEKSQHSIALESGTIDCTNGVTDVDSVNFLKDDGTAADGYGYVDSYKSNLLVLNYNCNQASLCSDINLRKAISYAVDTAALVSTAYGSAGHASACYSNPGCRDYDTAWESDDYYGYNVDKAKTYLAQSSYAGEQLILLTSSEVEMTTMATLVQAYCEAAGITIKVDYYDSNLTDEYRDDMNYHWDLYLNFTDSAYYTYELQTYLTDYWHEDGTSINRISDPTLTQLYDISSSKSTGTSETMQDLLDYIEEQVYSLAVGYYTQKVFYNANKIETLGVTSDLFNPTPFTSTLK